MSFLPSHSIILAIPILTLLLFTRTVRGGVDYQPYGACNIVIRSGQSCCSFNNYLTDCSASGDGGITPTWGAFCRDLGGTMCPSNQVFPDSECMGNGFGDPCKSTQEWVFEGSCASGGFRSHYTYHYACCDCPAGYVADQACYGYWCMGCKGVGEELTYRPEILGWDCVGPTSTQTAAATPIQTAVTTSTRTTTTTSKQTTQAKSQKTTSTTSTATGCSAQATRIPGPPADPPKPAGDGSGAWKSQDATAGDHAELLKFRAMARVADTLGLHHAASNLDHYLDDAGTDWLNKPEDIMNDIPSFKESVRALVSQKAGAAFRSASVGVGTTRTYQSAWKGFYATKDPSNDWFFALGGFSYAVAGSVTACKSSRSWVGTLSYEVHIFDRYNWDGGKSVTIGPFVFKDKELGRMHTVGLAREYIVRGSSGVITVTKWNGQTVPTPPNTGGRN